MSVVTTSEARAALSQIAAGFDAGDTEPVVFGSHRRPQGVIVPWAVWQALLEQAEDELGRRAAGDRLAADTGARYSTADVIAAAGLNHRAQAG